MGGVTTVREIEMTENSKHLLHTVLSVIINQCSHIFYVLIQLFNDGNLVKIKTCIHIVNSLCQYPIAYVSS